MRLDIQINNLGLIGQAPLLRDIRLSVEAGSVHTLMGPSGSGKSSLLLAIAGQLHAPMTYQGHIKLDAMALDHTPAHLRRIGMMFQDDLLFPQLNVLDNLLFGVPRHALSNTQRTEAAQTALAEIEMSHKAHSWPHQLSGGERTRVALMRALLAQPKALLLDEPFATLDADLRQRLRTWVFSTLKASGVPTLVVTHDVQDVESSGTLTRLLAAEPPGTFTC